MKFEKIFILGFLCIAILLCGCNSKKTSNLIKTPDKIIVYKDGKDYIIDKNDKDFNKIVELTNKRIVLKDLTIVKDIIDDNNIAEYKKEPLCIEFIYNQEQAIDVDTWKPTSIKYHKLFFVLVDKEFGTEENSIIYTFQYGDVNSYIDSSRGPIKSPSDLIKLINSMDLK